MRRLWKQIALAAAAFALVAPAANAQLLTFDDLLHGSACAMGELASPYGGMAWNNFGWVNKDCYTNSGYVAGAVSGQVVAFNAFGNDASFSRATPFSWSGYLTAAWRDDLTVTIVGSLGGSTVYTDVFQLGVTGPSFRQYLALVDEVSVSTTRSVMDIGPSTEGNHIAFDNLSVSPTATTTTPEPATLALVATGLLAVGGAARIRRRR